MKTSRERIRNPPNLTGPSAADRGMSNIGRHTQAPCVFEFCLNPTLHCGLWNGSPNLWLWPWRTALGLLLFDLAWPAHSCQVGEAICTSNVWLMIAEVYTASNFSPNLILQARSMGRCKFMTDARIGAHYTGYCDCCHVFVDER